jgi:beta-mannosidase
MQPVSVAITDEGPNGLAVHVVNDRATPLDAMLAVSLLRNDAASVSAPTRAISVSPRSAAVFSVDALYGTFHDTAYAYRFGPPGHDATLATLRDAAGAVISETVHFTSGLPNERRSGQLVEGSALRIDDRTVDVVLRSSGFAHFVAIQSASFVPDDNYFHMAPGTERVVRLSAASSGARFDAFVQPLNAFDGFNVVFSSVDV